MRKFKALNAVFAATVFIVGSAHAEPNATFKRCTAKADDMYKVCRDLKREYRNDDDCDGRLDRNYERCQQEYDKTMNSRFKDDGLDSNGRFQPIIIPQR